ncbi:unnamed protein product, partial [Ixodes pacificus]
VALDKRADPVLVSSSYRGLANFANTAPPTFFEDQVVQSRGLLGHVDAPDEPPARVPQDMFKDSIATNGGPLGHVDVPDETPARAPHDLTEDPTYTCGATHGNFNLPNEASLKAPHDMSARPTIASDGTLADDHPRQAIHKLRSDGASRTRSAQWVARFVVIMAALGNWVSST